MQYLDLTDLNFSPELWVACHDVDELNSKLAKRLWEENGMDVEEDFKEKLLILVGTLRFLSLSV